MRIILAALTLLAAVIGVARAQTVTLTPQTTIGGQFNPALGREPAASRPEEYGAIGGALRGGANYSTDGASKLNLTALFTLDATVSCTAGQASFTITPAAATPVLSAGPYWASVAPCGINQPVGAATPSTGVVTLGGAASTTYSGATTITIFSNSPLQQSANAGQYYGTLTASGSTVVLGTAVLTSGGYVANAGQQIKIMDAGAGGTGTLYEGTILSQATDGRTVTVTPAVPTAISAGSHLVWWGSFLFSPHDVGGAKPTYVSVPIAGAGDGLLAEAVLPIATYVDPLNITVAGSMYGLNAQQGELTKGVDDWPAVLAMAMAINGRGLLTQDGGERVAFFNNHYFLASASGGALQPVWNMLMCGGGQVYWPQSLHMEHGVARCDKRRQVNVASLYDIVPAVELKKLTALAAGSTATITFIGNSQFSQWTNDMGMPSSWSTMICDQFRAAYPDLTIKCAYFGIGGTTWVDLDPTGPRGGIPTEPLPPWYLPTSSTWASFVPTNTTVLIAEFTNVDGSNLSFGSMLSALNWIEANDGGPDILLALDGNQPINNAGYGFDAAASLERGFAAGGDYTLTGGGRIGVIDLNRAAHIAVDGFDPVAPIMKRAFYQAPGAGSTWPLPWTWPGKPVSNFDVAGYYYVFASPASMTSWWAAFNGELDFLVGGGSQLTPNQEVGGAAVGYPNGVVKIMQDAGSGHFAYQYNTFSFATNADCSGSAGQAVLTCANPEANIGHKLASISIPGAGASGAALVTTISNVSSDGKTLTLATTLSTAVSNVAAAIYRTEIPYTVSSVPYTWPTADNTPFGNCKNNSGAFTQVWMEVSMQGTRFKLDFCSRSSVGSALAIELPGIERAEIPFYPTISTPAGHVNGVLQFDGGGATAGAGGALDMFESDEAEPEIAPTVTMQPDLYAFCGPAYGAFGSTNTNSAGGECQNHRSTIGARLLDRMLADGLHVR